jgi:hypothetical protein
MYSYQRSHRDHRYSSKNCLRVIEPRNYIICCGRRCCPFSGSLHQSVVVVERSGPARVVERWACSSWGSPGTWESGAEKIRNIAVTAATAKWRVAFTERRTGKTRSAMSGRLGGRAVANIKLRVGLVHEWNRDYRQNERRNNRERRAGA